MSESRFFDLTRLNLTEGQIYELDLKSDGTFIANTSSQNNINREIGEIGGEDETKTGRAYNDQMIVLFEKLLPSRGMILAGNNNTDNRFLVESEKISYSVENPQVLLLSDLGDLEHLADKIFNIPGTITTVCTANADALQFDHFETCSPWLIALLDGRFPSNPTSPAINLLQALTKLESSCDGLLCIISPHEELKEAGLSTQGALRPTVDYSALVSLVTYIKDDYIQGIYHKFPDGPAQVQDGADIIEINALIALLTQLDRKDPLDQPRSFCERLCSCLPCGVVNHPEWSEALKAMVATVSREEWLEAQRQSIQTAEKMVLVLNLLDHEHDGSHDNSPSEPELAVAQPKSWCEWICCCWPRREVENNDLHKSLINK
jgi:hypothetical protein